MASRIVLKRLIASSTLVFGLLLAACGGQSPGTPSSGSSATTVPTGPAPGSSTITLAAGDPALETDFETLDAALNCTEFTNPDKEPVLLVHGTFTNGEEQYTWNYLPFLSGLGFDVCIVTYPNRGLDDQQISAEYIVYAILRINQVTGRQVDMAGHSQGASMPRWAIRWWPSVQDALDDFVLHAGPVKGTTVADNSFLGSMPPAFWQFQTGSNFVAAVNSVDQTPGDVDYSSIYTTYDELVQPEPVLGIGGDSAADLEPSAVNPKRVNIWLQGVCPSNTADHVSIGLTDGVTAQLTVDAFLNDEAGTGVADFTRAGGIGLCAAAPLGDGRAFPDTFAAVGPNFFNTVPADSPQTDSEPPLRAYAQP